MSVTPKTDIDALIERIRKDQGLTRPALLEWIAARDWKREGFYPGDPCCCPVACWLRARYETNIPIEVSDDDIAVDGFFCRAMPVELYTFVRWFDTTFGHAQNVSPRDTLERWQRFAI